MKIRMHWSFPAQSSELQKLRRRLRKVLTRLNCSEACIRDVTLAVNEACMNIIQHAYCENAGDILLEITDKDGWLTFRLTDFAPAVDISKCKSRDLDAIRPGGLGIHLIQSIMDEMEFLNTQQETGNTLQLRKRKT